jgi:DNA-binding transcriptional ArsR family regulator
LAQNLSQLFLPIAWMGSNIPVSILSISRQAIAKHLSALEDAGLVKSKRKGKYRVVIFNNEPLKNLLKGWIE